MARRKIMFRAIVASHATSWHDGGVAILMSPGELLALASERVGERYKHSWNSKLAYDYLKERLPGHEFGGDGDHFVDSAGGLETDNHHLYHAASAFYGSGFTDAAILVVDGQGPAGDHLSTTTIWDGRCGRINQVDDLNSDPGPFAARSIGHFYTAVTALAGFGELFAEGKAMALAAYGGPSPYLDLFREYVRTRPDGAFDVNPLLTRSILGHTLGPKFYGWPGPSAEQAAVWRELNALRQAPPGACWPTQDDMDIVFAGQAVLENVLVGLAGRARERTGRTRLCLAGGVALNCVANERIRRSGLFDEVFVVPAPGDDGQAVGKLYALLAARGMDCPPLDSVYLGPDYTEREIADAIRCHGTDFTTAGPQGAELLPRLCAGILARGNVVGWFQGRSELGPRALGHRSILADPRRLQMRDRVNRIKGREWFRPIAPIVPVEVAAEYFELTGPSPVMAFAVAVRPKRASAIPAAVHVDGTARVQTLAAGQEPLVHRLLLEFGRLTDTPVLLNTSFNGPDEPIVETPVDAIRTAVRLNLNYLVLGDHILERTPRSVM
jgi:carbamoyltransferase